MVRIRVGSTRKSVAMSRREASDGVRIRRACRATLPCILRKPYQRRRVSRFRQVGAGRQVDPAVVGDRVVDGGHHRQPELPLDVEDPVAQHLVVVDDVEVVDPVGSTRATRVLNVFGSGNPAVHIVRNSSTSTRSRNSRRLRDPERVGLAVEVEAGHAGQQHAIVELGVGLAGEHLDGVTEPHQLTAEVPDVDALAAAMRLAAVGQQCDSHAAPPSPSESPCDGAPF